jgi:hypothetical protein
MHPARATATIDVITLEGSASQHLSQEQAGPPCPRRERPGRWKRRIASINLSISYAHLASVPQHPSVHR